MDWLSPPCRLREARPEGRMHEPLVSSHHCLVLELLMPQVCGGKISFIYSFPETFTDSLENKFPMNSVLFLIEIANVLVSMSWDSPPVPFELHDSGSACWPAAVWPGLVGSTNTLSCLSSFSCPPDAPRKGLLWCDTDFFFFLPLWNEFRISTYLQVRASVERDQSPCSVWWRKPSSQAMRRGVSQFRSKNRWVFFLLRGSCPWSSKLMPQNKLSSFQVRDEKRWPSLSASSSEHCLLPSSLTCVPFVPWAIIFLFWCSASHPLMNGHNEER